MKKLIGVLGVGLALLPQRIGNRAAEPPRPLGWASRGWSSRNARSPLAALRSAALEPYEILTGTAYGELDPHAPGNARHRQRESRSAQCQRPRRVQRGLHGPQAGGPEKGERQADLRFCQPRPEHHLAAGRKRRFLYRERRRQRFPDEARLYRCLERLADGRARQLPVSSGRTCPSPWRTESRSLA